LLHLLRSPYGRVMAIIGVAGRCDVINSHAAEIAEIGFSRGRVFKSVPVPPITAVELGLEETWLTMKRALAYLPEAYGLALAHHYPRDPASPTAVLEHLPRGENARLLCLIGGLSAILGLFSLLPFPPFDGGQLLLCGVEAVSGRRIQDEPLKYLSRFGLAVMLFLMILSMRFAAAPCRLCRSHRHPWQIAYAGAQEDKTHRDQHGDARDQDVEARPDAAA
jgi:membrane-associated protease RseP (regulator of RpoE activity)